MHTEEVAWCVSNNLAFSIVNSGETVLAEGRVFDAHTQTGFVEKATLRNLVWDDLEESGTARFPYPPHGRIPNFVGAKEAAEQLSRTHAWQDASVIKVNPDAPQLPVRRAALRAGKTVYMAAPRLRDAKPFLRLDPADVTDIQSATTVSGVSNHGVAVVPSAVPPIDLIVAGSVGVTRVGARIGKGEGYSDLEWAVLCELGAVGGETTVATTVHDRQLLDGSESPLAPDRSIPSPEAHDVPLDLIATPSAVQETSTPYTRPAGVDWSILTSATIAEIPVLQSRAPTESD